ncbi:MAG: GBS Bsp-like repeat-containing protein [Clostridia bacterium]|nr:GBS Bsp-like repeat-containing protein [Clostridia bacterium]
MKNRLFRLFSFVTAIILIVSSFPLSASAASFNQIVNATTDIIMTNEGNYTTVVRNDNGSLSIGKICWHGTNALNLLKDIVALNPTQALSILGSSLYNEIITSYSWNTKIPTSAEASVIAVFLSTAESRKVQDETAWKYISEYVDHGMALGITEPEALVFFADFENQNGRAGAASFYYEVRNAYGTVNLGTLYAASSKNPRRTRTYNFCATINWNNYSNSPAYRKDDIAPEISDVMVSDITSQGYTVSCTASDNVNVTSIYFAVFHKDDGSQNAKWYKQETTATASMTIDIAEFGNRTGYYYTFIYAFDEAGNYAYVELNAIKVPDATPTEPKLSLTVSATTDGTVGGEIRWKASTSGGSGDYLYTFDLYKDGKLIDKRNYSDYNDFPHTVKTTGSYYVVVSVYDKVSGKTTMASSTETNIFIPIVANSFKADMPAAILGQSVSWSLDVTGGEGELQYSYTLYKDDTVIYSSPYKKNYTKFTYPPDDSGVYNVIVNIMDSRSQVVSVKSDDITVIRPLSVSNVSFSSDYAVAGKSVTCSAEVLGGTGSYTCKFSIYCDDILVLESENISTSEFTFTVPKGGNYTAQVTVKDADSTVTQAEGGNLTADEKAKKGDANCDGELTAADARYTLRYSAGLEKVDEAFLYAMDVNEDGRIKAADARLILRVVAKIDKF